MNEPPRPGKGVGELFVELSTLVEQVRLRAQRARTESVYLRFTHPPGHHDHMLWSLALAVEAAESGGGVVIPL